MKDIVRLNYDQPLAVLSQQDEDGLTTTTMILEKSKKVKFSPKIVTSAVAWVIGHRNGTIAHSTYYELDAKHLIDKYGFKYGAESSSSSFMKPQPSTGEQRWQRPTRESVAEAAPTVEEVKVAEPAEAE